MSKRGMLIILSGPSGCGKGTVVKQLLSRRDDTVFSISVTTRAPRPGEMDGVHYFFRTKDQFESMIQNEELLEYASYNGQYYGTPRPPIEEWLNAGKNVLLEIEVQGAQKVMARCEDYVSIFIAAPSMGNLEHRLRGRGTETEEVIRGRMDAAKQEMAAAKRYQYLVINDQVELAVERIESILSAEALRYQRMKTIWMEEDVSC